MATCSQDVLYHHFCETPLVPAFDNPDARNDFAVWAMLQLGGPGPGAGRALGDHQPLYLHRTVTEGLWKGKPVIGGDVGGIRLQVVNYHTGFLVNTPEGAAHRIRFLLHHDTLRKRIGGEAREFVREHFLLTRQLREYLTMFHILSSREDAATIYI